jgi:carbonic anhydrase
VGLIPEWNYDKHGSDWPDLYPNCADQFQSPINLIDAVTEYGKMYDIQDFATDESDSTYWDLEFPTVNFDLSKYTVDVYIDHNHGYAGFESNIGNLLWKADKKWDGMEFILHSPSEHTINGKQYDLEMQVYHKNHPEEEDEEAAAGGEAGSSGGGGHRRMAATAAASSGGASAEDGEETPRDESLFQI